MAKKKLNKKVAIIGSIILAFFVMGIIVVALHFSKDPAKFLRDAEVALEQKDYPSVERNYRQAYGCTKDDDLKIVILFKYAEFYLINNSDVDVEDLSFREPDWFKTIGCWKSILNIDPKNIEAQMNLLKYFYESADAGNDNAWKTVETQSSELIEVFEEKDLDPDVYVLTAKARALLEMGSLGQTTNREKTIEDAITELEKIRKLDAENIKIYQYLARSFLVKGQIGSLKGVIEAEEKASEKAEEILQEAIRRAPDNPKAYINLLETKLSTIDTSDKDAMRALRDEYDAVVEKFSSNAEVYASLSNFYTKKLDTLDFAIGAINKAIDLDNQNVGFALSAANQYYRRASLDRDTKLFLKAIDILNDALDLPDAQDSPGPRQFLRKTNKHLLFTLLSTWYIELALDSKTEDEKQKYISKAEATIHQIEQLLGSKDNLSVLKWHGMLSLVKGNQVLAIQQMYKVYEGHKASGQNDPMLSYILSKALNDSSEIGVKRELYESIIFSKPNMVALKPKVLLDYGDVLLQLYSWTNVVEATQLYEQIHKPTPRSIAIRIKAYIRAGMLDEAHESLVELAQLSPDSKIILELKLRLTSVKVNKAKKSKQTQEADSEKSQEIKPELYQQGEIDNLVKQRIELLKENLEIEPDRLGFMLNLCQIYVETNRIDEAKELVDRFLIHSPDNLTANAKKIVLLEPDPANISEERISEIKEEIFKDIPDKLEQALALGQHYKQQGQDDKAMAEYKKAYEIEPDNAMVITSLFDRTLSQNDLTLAEQLMVKIRNANIDECDGELFAARLDIIREDFTSALKRLDNCLEKLPIFSYGYLLRSQVNKQLGNREEAITDITKAARMDPLSNTIAKQMASLLYERNLRLGRNVTPEQIAQTERVFIKATLLNPKDALIQNAYAEYIYERNPEKALALQQDLQKKSPTVSNILSYANMAVKTARNEKDTSRKKGLFEIAGSAYERALKIEPGNKEVLGGYSSYLRFTGQQQKAVNLFSGNEEVLWKFYLDDGQYEKAKEILEKLFAADSQNVEIIRGMVIVAEKTRDDEGVRTYTEKLLAIDNTTDNELFQIRMYLEMGFVKEVDTKLKSFRERFPDNSRAMLMEAWNAMSKGQLDKALKLMNRSLEIDPENATAWRLRGRVNRLLRNTNQAVADMQKSKNINSNPSIRVELAKIYQQTGRIPAAIGELTEALKDEQAPENARVMLERLYLQSGRKRDLKKFYRQNLEKFPDSGLWYFRAGNFYMDEGEYSKANELLKKALEISMESKTVVNETLDMYLENLFLSKNYQELLRQSTKHIDTPYASIAYAQMAQAYMKMGSRTKSVYYYRKAIEKVPVGKGVTIGILENMLKIVGPNEVVKWCNETLQQNPSSRPANLTLFNLVQKSGDYNKALGHINILLTKTRTNEPAWSDYMMKKCNTLVMAYMKTSNKKYLLDGISEFEKILEFQPNNATVLNNLGYLLADNNEQIEKAVQYAKRASEAKPNDGNNLDTYAYTLCKTGEYAKAEEQSQMAIQIFERNSQEVIWDVYRHLGMAQEGLGKKGEAAASYRQALEIAGQRISKIDKDQLNESIERLLQ